MSKDQLIAALNRQLAAEYQAIIQYLHYAAVVTGPYRPELVTFFQTEVADETLHAQYLAGKVAALGGDPTTEPKAVPHSTDPRTLLQYVLSAEEEAVKAYAEIIKIADEVGEYGVRIQAENFLQEEATHTDETRKLLAGHWEA